MNRATAKRLWEVIKAYGEGKTIQYKARDTGRWCDWKDSVCSDCTFYNDVEYRIKPEENYTIEQNAGENRIEGGVIGISGSVSEKHYRPFKDCNELKVWFYINKTGISKSVAEEFSKITPPSIWVRHKFNKDDLCLITCFGKIEANTIPVVETRGMDLTMKELFENWEFLDGSLCGCLEE